MKKLLFLLFAMANTVVYAQSKKKQIIILNNRVDSFRLALSNEIKLSNKNRITLNSRVDSFRLALSNEIKLSNKNRITLNNRVDSFRLALSSEIKLSKQNSNKLNNRVDSFRLALSNETQVKLKNEKRDELKINNLKIEIENLEAELKAERNRNNILNNELKKKELQTSSLEFAQLPTIKAIGGDGQNVNWNIEYQEYQNEFGDDGPGFINGDCSMGGIPTKASSTLKGQGSKNYSIKNLIDDNPMTAWVEGVTGYGIGEWFEIKGKANIIYNGYQSSPTNWKNNSRVKKFKIYANGKPICFLELTDEMGDQHFDLSSKVFDTDGYGNNLVTLRFEIIEVYKGLKWDDVAISQINHQGCCFGADTYVNIVENNVGISEIKTNDEILCVDIDSNIAYKSQVNSIVSVEHVNLIKMTTTTKSLTLTKEHPINIKGYGFISLLSLSSKLNVDISNITKEHVLVLTWDEENKVVKYEKLNTIEVIQGKQKTYSIRNITKGNHYIVNGILTTTY